MTIATFALDFFLSSDKFIKELFIKFIYSSHLYRRHNRKPRDKIVFVILKEFIKKLRDLFTKKKNNNKHTRVPVMLKLR